MTDKWAIEQTDKSGQTDKWASWPMDKQTNGQRYIYEQHKRLKKIWTNKQTNEPVVASYKVAL